MKRWELLYGEGIGEGFVPSPTFLNTIKPREFYNPITRNWTLMGETPATRISTNSQYERYGKGLGMSVLNPKFGMHVSELLRMYRRPRLTKAQFEYNIGYPDPMNEVKWIRQVCDILANLGNLPLVAKGTRLPIRRFDQQVCLAAMEHIDNEPTPAFYYVGPEGYFEYAKTARAVYQLFDQDVHITKVGQYEYWAGKILSYLKTEGEQYPILSLY